VCVFVCEVESHRGSERDHEHAQTKNERTHARTLTFLNRVASFWHTGLQERKKEKGKREKEKGKRKRKRKKKSTHQIATDRQTDR